MNNWWSLFVTFLKVNLLTTSGTASVGLLYSEAVGKLMSLSLIHISEPTRPY